MLACFIYLIKDAKPEKAIQGILITFPSLFILAFLGLSLKCHKKYNRDLNALINKVKPIEQTTQPGTQNSINSTT